MGLYDYLAQEAQRIGVDPAYAARVMHIESGGNPNAVSPKGAAGPMQLMPGTAAELGVDPRDPYQNITGGLRYIKQLSDRFNNDPRAVAAAYNAGPTRTARALAATGDIPHNPETDAYVARVAQAGAPTMPSRYADPKDFEGGTVVTQPPATSRAASGYADPADFANGTVVNAGMMAGQPQAQPKTAGAPINPIFDKTQHPILRQLGLTGRDVLAGASKLAGIVGDPANIVTNAVLGTHLAPVSGMGDQLADSAGLPRPEGTLENYVNNGAQALVGAGGMSALARGAAALSPAIARTVAPLLTNQTGQAVGAVTGTTSAQAADDTVGKNLNPVARWGLAAAAGLVGGGAGAGAANRVGSIAAGASTMTPAQQALVDASKQYKFPLRVGDITGPNSVAQNVENAATAIPGGKQMAISTAAQTNAGISRALTDMAGKYRPGDLPEGAPNVDAYLANDLRTGYASAKQATSHAFDNVSRVIAGTDGAGPVDMAATRGAAQDLLANYPKVFETLTVPKDLQAKLSNIVGDTGPQNSTILQQNGQPFQKPPSIGFDDVRALSQGVGKMMRGAQQQAKFTGSEDQLGAVNRLYGAVQNDLSGWLQNQPQEVQQAYGNAIDTFKNRVLPYRSDDKLYGVASSRAPADGTPDLAAQGLYKNLFNPQQTQRAPFAFNLLSGTGQSAAAYQALQDAVSGATSPNAATGLRAGAGLKALDLSNPVLNGIADNTIGMPGDVGVMRALLNAGRRTNDVLADPKNGSRLLSWETLKGLGGLGASTGLGAEHFGHDGAIIGGLTAAAGALGSTGVNAASAWLPKSLLFSDPGSAASRYMPGMLGGNVLGSGLLSSPDDSGQPVMPPQGYGLIH